MTRFVLDIIYVLLLLALSPLWLYRMIRFGRYRSDIGQRLGASPIRYGLQPVIWIHGVSLGEVNAARSLVAQLHSQLPDYRVVISTSTETGMDGARKLFAPDHAVFRWPLDFSFAVARSLDRVRPALVVLMEGDVWPNFLAACNSRKIPVVVVNARMSANKGYPRYKKLGRLATNLFNRLTVIGAQDESYAERFRSLGVAPEKIQVTGMLKFDTAVLADRIAGQDALAAALGIAPQHKLIVAGGTGPGEEEIVVGIYRQLTQRHADARLVVVPRKPERFDEVAGMIAAAGLAVVRRSEHGDGTVAAPLPADSVALIDTMGDLRKAYALASCVFVGRSLVHMGGSDMIEAAALGKAVAFGPHTFNFPQADALTQHGAVRVADAAALQSQLDAWLTDAAAAQAAGRTVQQYIASQQGATTRNVEMICRVLGRVPAVAPGGIATDALG